MDELILDELKEIVADIGAATVAQRMRENFPQTINNWLSRGVIPDGKIRLFSEAIEYRKTPHDLNKVLYPHIHDGLPNHLREQVA